MDLILGDPRWFPHPVRGIGWMIGRTEEVLRRFAKTPQAEKTAGVLLVILVILPVLIISQFLLLASFKVSVTAGLIVSVFLAFTTFAARGLGDAAKSVLKRLDAGDIEQARTELAMIVGRDTADLDEEGIARAVVETVAENASDGVIAPLFYLAIGGPALALAYKAVNTLDSMVGYKNERYINLGWAAARLDDVANYVPARITAVLICLASNLYSIFKSAIRNPQSSIRTPWRIMLRDGKNHPSPNSGYPEAAMAGALGIRLGGLSAYGGHPNLKPYLGDALNRIDKKHIEKSVHFMYCTTSFAVLGAAGILFLF
jgi:adenosylcobinamide-phosphate synthase